MATVKNMLDVKGRYIQDKSHQEKPPCSGFLYDHQRLRRITRWKFSRGSVPLLTGQYPLPQLTPPLNRTDHTGHGNQ